jgi:hypothetical protein
MVAPAKIRNFVVLLLTLRRLPELLLAVQDDPDFPQPHAFSAAVMPYFGPP